MLTELQDEYWDLFRKYAAARGSRFADSGSRNGTYTDWGIGKSGCRLGAAVYLKAGQAAGARVQLSLDGPDASATFARLSLSKGDIDDELGPGVVWDPKEGARRSSIHVEAGPSPRSREDWPTIQEWTLSQLEAFDKTFRARL